MKKINCLVLRLCCMALLAVAVCQTGQAQTSVTEEMNECEACIYRNIQYKDYGYIVIHTFDFEDMSLPEQGIKWHTVSSYRTFIVGVRTPQHYYIIEIADKEQFERLMKEIPTYRQKTEIIYSGKYTTAKQAVNLIKAVTPFFCW